MLKVHIYDMVCLICTLVNFKAIDGYTCLFSVDVTLSNLVLRGSFETSKIIGSRFWRPNCGSSMSTWMSQTRFQRHHWVSNWWWSFLILDQPKVTFIFMIGCGRTTGTIIHRWMKYFSFQTHCNLCMKWVCIFYRYRSPSHSSMFS